MQRFTNDSSLQYYYLLLSCYSLSYECFNLLTQVRCFGFKSRLFVEFKHYNTIEVSYFRQKELKILKNQSIWEVDLKFLCDHYGLF